MNVTPQEAVKPVKGRGEHRVQVKFPEWLVLLDFIAKVIEVSINIGLVAPQGHLSVDIEGNATAKHVPIEGIIVLKTVEHVHLALASDNVLFDRDCALSPHPRIVVSDAVDPHGRVEVVARSLHGGKQLDGIVAGLVFLAVIGVSVLLEFAAIDDGASGDKKPSTHDNVARLHVTVAIVATNILDKVVRGHGELPSTSTHERALRIFFKERELSLNLLGVDPVVIALTVCHIARGGCHAFEHDTPDGAVVLAILIFSLEDGLDEVRVLLGILTNDGSRAIGRCVVVHDNLKGEACSLHHKAIEALPQKRLVVVDKTTD